ncbi:MAG: hypothetical protein AAF387_18270 [Pseudomonadota bacterium]
MSDKISLNCWNCGDLVADIPLPMARNENCPACHADLHVCRQYDTSKASACQEPVAEHIVEKSRANFCGYLMVNTSLQTHSGDSAEQLGELNNLFGLDSGEHAPSPSTSSEAKSALDDLFGLSDDSK